MRPVVWLDKHNLILVTIIQWPFLVHLDGKMKRSDAHFHDGIQSGGAAIRLADEFRAPEAILWHTSTWHEDRAIVDCNGDGLLG
jgi:hypothetical protein